MATRIKRNGYIPRREEPVLIELTCYCCQEKFIFGVRKPCGCNAQKPHCAVCLKCEQHCACKKPRLVSEYPTAFAVHRSVA